MCKIIDNFSTVGITIEWDDGKGGKVKLPSKEGKIIKKEYDIDLSSPKIIKISKQNGNWPDGIPVTVSNVHLAIDAQACSNNGSNPNQCDNFTGNNYNCKLDAESITTKDARCNVVQVKDCQWKITPNIKPRIPDTDYYVDAFCLKLSPKSGPNGKIVKTNNIEKNGVPTVTVTIGEP